MAVRAENQPPGGGEHPGCRPRDHIEVPAGCAGLRIHRQNAAPSMLLRDRADRAGLIPLAVRMILLGLVKQVAAFRTGKIQQPGPGAIGLRLPVVSAAHAGAGPGPVFAGFVISDQVRASLRIEAVGPTDLGVGAGMQEFAAGPVQRVEEAVAVGLDQRLNLAPVDIQIRQHRIANGIPIVDIVRRELKVPPQLSGVRVDRHHTAGV